MPMGSEKHVDWLLERTCYPEECNLGSALPCADGRSGQIDPQDTLFSPKRKESRLYVPFCPVTEPRMSWRRVWEVIVPYRTEQNTNILPPISTEL